MIAIIRCWYSRPPSSPVPAATLNSTNENSPTWHSEAADRMPTRNGSRRTSAVPRTMANLPNRITPSSPAVLRSSPATPETSSSMPTETKNRLARTSRAGIRSAIAWWRNSLPATISPARNAPSASEMPASDSAHVVPKHTRNTVRMNSSRSPRPGHERQQPRDQEAGRHQHAGQDRDGRADREQYLARGAVASGQQGNGQDHRHHAQVLEHQDAHGQAAVRGIQLAARGQRAQDYGRAGNGDHAPQEHRRPRRQPERPGNARRACQRHCDLDAAAQEHRLPEPAQAVDGQLQADAEQQQDDADLRQQLDLMGVVDQAQSGRSGQHAGQDEPGDRRDADAAQQRHHHHGGPEHDHEVLEEAELRHATVPYRYLIPLLPER